jgi:hypothetical protein
MFDIQTAKSEIEERNRIRAEAGLPLLSVATELRKAYEHQCKTEFDRFMDTSPLRQRVEAKLLAIARRKRDDPKWRPTGMLSGGGYAFYICTRKVMRRIWLRQDDGM